MRAYQLLCTGREERGVKVLGCMMISVECLCALDGGLTGAARLASYQVD